MLQASVLSPSFHFYMKPLHEAIHQFVVWYNQYNDDTQLYLLTTSKPIEAIKVLFQRLENICLLKGKTHQPKLLSRMGIAPSEEYEFVTAQFRHVCFLGFVLLVLDNFLSFNHVRIFLQTA